MPLVDRRSVLNASLLAASVIGAAAIMAAVWLRTPALWPPLPDTFWSFLDRVFGSPTSQELVADREFLVFGLLSCLVLGSVLVGLATGRRLTK